MIQKNRNNDNEQVNSKNRRNKESPSVRVYLGASKGREDFYKKFGFINRVDAGLGHGMILQK